MTNLTQVTALQAWETADFGPDWETDARFTELHNAFNAYYLYDINLDDLKAAFTKACADVFGIQFDIDDTDEVEIGDELDTLGRCNYAGLNLIDADEDPEAYEAHQIKGLIYDFNNTLASMKKFGMDTARYIEMTTEVYAEMGLTIVGETITQA